MAFTDLNPDLVGILRITRLFNNGNRQRRRRRRRNHRRHPAQTEGNASNGRPEENRDHHPVTFAIVH